jgi:hypothetical protein
MSSVLMIKVSYALMHTYTHMHACAHAHTRACMHTSNDSNNQDLRLVPISVVIKPYTTCPYNVLLVKTRINVRQTAFLQSSGMLIRGKPALVVLVRMQLPVLKEHSRRRSPAAPAVLLFRV